MRSVVRDHNGALVAGQTICRTIVNSVFEAEAYPVYEGLRTRVIIKSDSLLIVLAIQCSQDNLLEVGHILNAYRTILDSRPGY